MIYRWEVLSFSAEMNSCVFCPAMHLMSVAIVLDAIIWMTPQRRLQVLNVISPGCLRWSQ